MAFQFFDRNLEDYMSSLTHRTWLILPQKLFIRIIFFVGS